MADETQNKEAMKEAIDTLNQIASNNSTPKTIKKSITDIIADLNNDEYSLSVRAANTISLLDDVTQDPNMPSMLEHNCGKQFEIRKYKRQIPYWFRLILKIEEYLETLPENVLSGEDVQLPKKSFGKFLIC